MTGPFPGSVIGVGGVAQPVAEEIERKDGQNDRHDRQHQPGIERDDADVLRLVEEDAPAGDRRPQAESQKRQGCLAQDHPGDDEGRRGDQMAHEARQQVAADDPRRARAHQHRGGAEILLAQ